ELVTGVQTCALPISAGRLFALAAAAAGLALAATASAPAMTIERVVSPGGIKAWLVHDRTLPLIAIEFAIRGSADQDPADKPGVRSEERRVGKEGRSR